MIIDNAKIIKKIYNGRKAHGYILRGFNFLFGQYNCSLACDPFVIC